MGASSAPLFNLSLGEPLDAWPLVDAAFAILELAVGPLAFDRASRLMRSPFLDGGEAELSQRARLDAALRRIAPASVSLTRLRQSMSQARGAPECPRLTRLLDRVAEAARESARAAPHEWARRFTRILAAAGFPGERTLDSVEYQTLEKWREALSSLAALGVVSASWSGGEARARLQRLCGETVFQPKSGAAPVQVLGLLESVGLAFDHLWVSGLTEDTWPIAARPQPLIAPALQRKAGIPQASPEASLEVDRAITQAWKASAAEVVFSSARADGDRELLASPLLADVERIDADALAIPAYALLRDALYHAGHTKGAISTRHDDMGPLLGTGPARGGTAVLADQAACPFRAFAHYRLDARALERPEPGLGPPERGQLLHAMMAHLWKALKDQRTLAATDEAGLATLIAQAAAHAVERVRRDRPGRLEGRFAELERERLAGIARDWLAIERGRPPFSVEVTEGEMPLSAGSLALRGRIDRIDHLEDGGLAVIDYKSGRVSVAAWMGERPDDAQLPLYALAAGEGDVRAVAYARLKTGDLGFAGVARDGEAIPGVKDVAGTRSAKGLAASWTDLIAMWRREVDRLGENFASGDAKVDPKNLLATCERCDLKTLCRVHERLSPLDEGDAFDEAGGEEEAE
jgi:probable DNA repair protein